ncbi:MAG TPA: preprotein translocase subunit SecA [Candidatus Omnitrophica bacterium]|nr:preprotein translocase subunit SecA [Candidatus Omnitrophota bacterium]
MINFIFSKILGTQNDRVLKNMGPLIEGINKLEPEVAALSDDALRSKTAEFKQRIQVRLKDAGHAEADSDLRKKTEGRVLEELLPEAFAVVREVSKRTIGLRHFDVQLIGGIVLHRGGIAEMATGEGKTLVATLPVYLNALMGRGVHVVTVNDYLAKRDREWMGPIYEFLGLSVGVIQHDMEFEDKLFAYNCDIVFGTNNEFGFDYLRDNMVVERKHMVQRELYYAIVDEVDSILVDEARTPLIISGPTDDSVEKYYTINRIIPKLKRRLILEKEEIEAKYKGEDLSVGFDAVVDEKNHTVSLTEEGIAKCEQLLGVANIYDDLSGEWAHHIIQAIKAHDLFKRDVDYVVKDGKVIIVDEFTGRLMPGRRWSEGMHQAVEAKENLRIERENQTLATITLQNYFRLYHKLAGMTGTAFTEANEFKQIYKLDVVVIPTNRPMARQNYADSVYKSKNGKYNAVIEDIKQCYEKGRPVLVGTISIEKSELLGSMLKKIGIPHSVLNAKYHEMEASIVAQAGRYKGVTIATNMAGRGTDILLGGNPEFMAKSIMAAKKLTPSSPEYKEEYAGALERLKAEARIEHDKVVEAGGLHVIGTERHEARRIDNQLRGRSGRQGDPGSSRFYVSLEDDLMRLFGSDRLVGIMDKLGLEEDTVIEHPWVTHSIETAQKRVESYNFEIRKHLLEYDDVMNKQREVIYSERRLVLEGEDLKALLFDMIDEVMAGAMDIYLSKEVPPEEWNWAGLEGWIKQKFGPSVPVEKDKLAGMTEPEIKEELIIKVRAFYEEKERALGQERMRGLERMVMLHVIDSRWKEHLYSLDYLKEGIGLRAYASRDPLIEYQREAYQMFVEMMQRIKEEAVEFIFRMQVVEEKAFRGVFSSLPQKAEHEEFTPLQKNLAAGRSGRIQDAARQMQPDAEEAVVAEEEDGAVSMKREGPKVGRNDPCPCGSGKKYKKCCGQ